jgi:hypothetical protein
MNCTNFKLLKCKNCMSCMNCMNLMNKTELHRLYLFHLAAVQISDKNKDRIKTLAKLPNWYLWIKLSNEFSHFYNKYIEMQFIFCHSDNLTPVYYYELYYFIFTKYLSLYIRCWYQNLIFYYCKVILGYFMGVSGGKEWTSWVEHSHTRDFL